VAPYYDVGIITSTEVSLKYYDCVFALIILNEKCMNVSISSGRKQ